MGFDRIRCDHVAAAVFWITHEAKSFSKNESKHWKRYSFYMSRDCPHLIAELEEAHRIADFVCDDINVQDGKQTNDNYGAIFSSWLHGLVPATEAAKIYRPWNFCHGESGAVFSNKDYTPVEYVLLPHDLQPASPDAVASTSDSMAAERLPIYPESSRLDDLGQKVGACCNFCQLDSFVLQFSNSNISSPQENSVHFDVSCVTTHVCHTRRMNLTIIRTLCIDEPS